MINDDRNEIKDFFLEQIMQGRVIEDISIEKSQDTDDDWVSRYR